MYRPRYNIAAINPDTREIVPIFEGMRFRIVTFHGKTVEMIGVGNAHHIGVPIVPSGFFDDAFEEVEEDTYGDQ